MDPPPWRPGLREDLAELAADAASRAWELATGLSADAGLTLEPGDDLARQALAWRQGGLPGLDLLRAEWDPVADDPDAAGLLAAARTVLRTKTGAAAEILGNRITAGHLQLRLGRDLRWYPYAQSDGDWEPSGAPQADVALAVADL